MGIGKILKGVLAKRNIKVSELSDMTGIPRSTLYSMIQRDSSKIDSKHLSNICNVLDVSIDTFYEEQTMDALSMGSIIKKCRNKKMSPKGEEQ